MYASQVHSIAVEHEAPDILPKRFDVTSEKVTFKAKLKIGTESCITGMEGKQFRLVSNSCRTGHKLQGCTCIEMLVNEWFYSSNWPYVVLSRVRSMAGLYIREKLEYDLTKYEMPDNMKRMIQRFRDTISLSELTDDDYATLLRSY